MKLKTRKAFRHGNKTHRRGAEIELAEAAGKDLVRRGFAVEVSTKAKAKAKAAKAADKGHGE